MGRDKTPKPAAAPAEAKTDIIIGLDGKPQRPPRGHKQRGAGNVITAKAPIVTSDGIILKIHERLPSQLLQEFCQKEKRPVPKYFSEPPGHRILYFLVEEYNLSSMCKTPKFTVKLIILQNCNSFKVILEDAKNAKNNLEFCPSQPFESDRIAKDYVALLALWHFQKTLPLERKVPEPFATTWLQMVAEEKEKNALSQPLARGKKNATAASTVTAIATAATTINSSVSTILSGVNDDNNLKISSSDNSDATTVILVEETNFTDLNNAIDDSTGKESILDYISKNKETYKKKADVEVEKVLDRSTADWLCDNCNGQNFAKLLSGVVRTKCCKCQAVRGSGGSLVLSLAEVDAVNLKNSLKPKKAPPVAVLSLKSTIQIVSQEEIEKKLIEESLVKRQIAYLEELKKANKPTQIFLSSLLRKMLENALIENNNKYNDMNNTNNNDNSNHDNDFDNDNNEDEDKDRCPTERIDMVLQKIKDHSIFPGREFITILSNINSQKQSESVENVISKLRKQGFKDKIIYKSLISIISKSKNMGEEILNIYKIKNMISLQSFELVFQEKCYQYLCQYVDNADLPNGFDPRSNENTRTFQIYKKEEKKEEKKEDRKKEQKDDILSRKNQMQEINIGQDSKEGNYKYDHSNHKDDDNNNTNNSSNKDNNYHNNYNNQSLTSCPMPSNSSILNSTSTSTSILSTATLSSHHIQSEKEKHEECRIVSFLTSYGWTDADCNNAIKVSFYLHSLKNALPSIPLPLSLPLPPIITIENQVDPNSVILGAASSPSDFDNSDSDIILDPSNIPPVGVTALHLLWMSFRILMGDRQRRIDLYVVLNEFLLSFKFALKKSGDDNDSNKYKNNGNNGNDKILNIVKIDEEYNEREEIISTEIETLSSIFPDSLRFFHTDEDQFSVSGIQKKETEEKLSSLKSEINEKVNKSGKINKFEKVKKENKEVESNIVRNSEKEKEKKMEMESKRIHILTMLVERVQVTHTACNSETFIDIFISSFMGYPKNVPMILLRNKSISELNELNCKNQLMKNSICSNNNDNNDNDDNDKDDNYISNILLYLQMEIWNKTKEYEGDTLIFQIASYVEEKLGNLINSYNDKKIEKKYNNNIVESILDQINVSTENGTDVGTDIELLLNRCGEAKKSEQKGNDNNNGRKGESKIHFENIKGMRDKSVSKKDYNGNSNNNSNNSSSNNVIDYDSSNCKNSFDDSSGSTTKEFSKMNVNRNRDKSVIINMNTSKGLNGNDVHKENNDNDSNTKNKNNNNHQHDGSNSTISSQPSISPSLSEPAIDDSISEISSSSSSSYNNTNKRKSQMKPSFWSTIGNSNSKLDSNRNLNDEIQRNLNNYGNNNKSLLYKKMLEGRKKLPAWNSRTEFLGLIANNRAIVVTGETGCGKTTQIPQFIHEVCPEAKIVICQPRRLAAVGVATRVAEEMACPIGDQVGYMVRGDSKATARTRIVFCTYGVLLRRLQDDPDIAAIDYVVLDEVHERGLDSDFTLALLMSALSRRKTLRLILMSATIATDKFATYLGNGLSPVNTSTSTSTSSSLTSNNNSSSSISDWHSNSNNRSDLEYGMIDLEPSIPSFLKNAVPVMFIPGYTYPVTEYYKNNFEDILRCNVDMNPRRALFGVNESLNIEDQDPLKSRIGGMKRPGDIDFDLLVRLIVRLALGHRVDGKGGKEEKMFLPAEGSVLIFLPGVPEINRTIRLLENVWQNMTKPSHAPKLKIMPLHGNLSPMEQKSVFEIARNGELKIVVSTNVAEASVTLPDVTVVIDSCRVKEIDFDVEKQMTALIMKKASKDSLRQRRGRAGRVQSGRCFRMITEVTYELLPPHSVPEMLRAPLESLILQVKAMDLNESCEDLLNRCIDPPVNKNVRTSQSILTQMRALDQSTGKITPLGRHLASLPCDPKIGRLLVYGALLGCTYAASAIAASLSTRSPFNSDEAKAKLASLTSPSSPSDHTVAFTALKLFADSGRGGDQKRFCVENDLSYERMVEIRTLQRDLLDGLVSLGFLQSLDDGLNYSNICNRNLKIPKIVTAVICAGLYPQIGKIVRPAQRFVDTQGGKIEKDIQVQELEFFILDNSKENDNYSIDKISSCNNDKINKSITIINNNNNNNNIFGNNSSNDETAGSELIKVSIHNSSLNAKNVTFKSSNYIVYSEKKLSSQYGASKNNLIPFLHDISEVSPFPLLFFCGELEAQYTENTVTVDKWIQFGAPGKIVSLILSLRRAFDQLLDEKILNPEFEISESKVLEAVCLLLATDGLSS